MIDSDSKYFCLSGDIPVGQRRVVSVTMDEEQDDESAIEHFSRYSSLLSHATGPIPDVDLVAYPPCLAGSAKKAVFKYYFLWQYAQMSWKEMNLWMRLPHHPNIVLFDRIFVDELEGRVENMSRVFRLEWLQQLINVVDNLNIRYGIAHQDIAPRNLLVGESTDSVMLFDLSFAASINYPSPGEENGFRSLPHEEQNLDDLGLEWAKHPGVKLDHPMASYLLILQEWRERRAGDLYARYERRQDVRDRGDKALNWERPPQRLLDNGTWVLSSGKVIHCPKLTAVAELI
ncbi:hypothetical protein BGZ61DRAFT_491659 [Ilyonectria robusta]|uniref:uncharacterized protein n=1 Tax=Ilyonectria robusta TaxID=1079257 RepID=UPI001E8E3DEF|nr:uncharacterized protein BGZ61DRAFT_491659 [Ilyonectria robusta]KAH8729253.1 hypothetical protein BGZ61DRAFT_491659 [Ilyonectria robusta]